MLYIVLLLVLGALGLLITALTTANTLWAWLSVGLSVIAAVILVLDWVGARKSKSAPVQSEPDVDEDVADDDGWVEEQAAEPEPPHPPAADRADGVDPEAEPAEEPTDATDLLVVSELAAEVRVLDERPRYHLASCAWLAQRPSIPLPIREARQLGFTPCGRCGPDAVLAAQHRSASA